MTKFLVSLQSCDLLLGSLYVKRSRRVDIVLTRADHSEPFFGAELPNVAVSRQPGVSKQVLFPCYFVIMYEPERSPMIPELCGLWDHKIVVAHFKCSLLSVHRLLNTIG